MGGQHPSGACPDRSRPSVPGREHQYWDRAEYAGLDVGKHTGEALAGRGQTVVMGVFVIRRAARTCVGLVVSGLRLLYGLDLANGSHTERPLETCRVRRVLVLRLGICRGLVAMALI